MIETIGGVLSQEFLLVMASTVFVAVTAPLVLRWNRRVIQKARMRGPDFDIATELCLAALTILPAALLLRVERKGADPEALLKWLGGGVAAAVAAILVAFIFNVMRTRDKELVRELLRAADSGSIGLSQRLWKLWWRRTIMPNLAGFIILVAVLAFGMELS